MAYQMVKVVLGKDLHSCNKLSLVITEEGKNVHLSLYFIYIYIEIHLLKNYLTSLSGMREVFPRLDLVIAQDMARAAVANPSPGVIDFRPMWRYVVSSRY